MGREVVLAGGARTPIGSFLGALSQIPAPVLASVAIRASLARAGVAAERVDEVILGNVIGAGLGQNVARQASIGAGIPASVGATTVNKVCGSGLKAVMLAAQAVRCRDAELVVAGGTENMSAAPYLLPKARGGYRLGNGELVDALLCDGLWDQYNHVPMGAHGDRCAAQYGVSRKEQDDYAVASYRRAIEAESRGELAEEIAPVGIAHREKNIVVDRDEEPGRFQEEKLRALKPVFGPEGTVTAGNASSINDGAAAVIVLSQDKAAELGVQPQARWLGCSSFAREPEWFTLAPIGAIARLMDRLGLTVEDVDLFEINEAFSVVPLLAMRELGIAHDKLNVVGGAVALGHPIGASGAKILVTLLHAMKRRGARIGIASLCIGGGEAVAVAVERC